MLPAEFFARPAQHVDPGGTEAMTSGGGAVPTVANGARRLLAVLAAALCAAVAVPAGALPADNASPDISRKTAAHTGTGGIEAGDVFRDCPHCPEMAVVPSGSFAMGAPPSEEARLPDSAKPVHRVTIRGAFAIGVHEVTRGEFGRFASATDYRPSEVECRSILEDTDDAMRRDRRKRSWRSPGFSQTDSHPAVCVGWEDVQAYVAWLSRETGEDYRLPSESEWEYAARAGTATRFHWGDGSAPQCRYANGADLTFGKHVGLEQYDPGSAADCDDGYFRTSPVGSFEANAFGLHDVHGNVSEWVQDCWHESYAGAPGDGSAWMRDYCILGVRRGGAWNSGPNNLGAAVRGLVPDVIPSSVALGFRVARALPEGERAAARERDKAAFAAARRADTVAAYDDYLSEYPSGARMMEAWRLRTQARGIEVGDVFRDCPHCPEMAVVPSGSFAMGSPPSEEGRQDNEGPVRRVTVGAPFAIGVHEVTRGEFARFMSSMGGRISMDPWEWQNICSVWEDGRWQERWGLNWRNPGFSQTDSHPVVCVRLHEARGYARWLSRETGEDYRLPSESEWEYAARAGTATRYWWGDDIGRNRANCNGCESRWDGKNTAPVGSFAANAFGLHDVHGNVSEWTRDCRNDSDIGDPGDGSAGENGCDKNAVRGGSWGHAPEDIRAAIRSPSDFDWWYRYYNRGFRVARAVTP